MKKRMFFGLTLFIMMFTLVAWQYAVEEIVELEQTTSTTEQEAVSEAEVVSQNGGFL